MAKGYYKAKDIRRDGTLKLAKLRERQNVSRPEPVNIFAIRKAMVLLADYMRREEHGCGRMPKPRAILNKARAELRKLENGQR